MEQEQARASQLPGILAAAGGVVVLIACFLTWGKVSAGQTGLIPEETGNATDFDFGWFAIAGGVVLLAAGVVWLAGKAPLARRPLAIVAIVAAALPVLIAGYNIATKDRQVDDALSQGFEESTGQRPTDEQLALLKAQLEELGIGVSLEFGIYLTVLGGLIGLAGGLLALRAKEPEQTSAASGFDSGTLAAPTEDPLARPAPPPPPAAPPMPPPAPEPPLQP